MTRLRLASPAEDDRARVDRIGALEALKAAAAAAQAHDLVAFADSQLAVRCGAGRGDDGPARPIIVGSSATGWRDPPGH